MQVQAVADVLQQEHKDAITSAGFDLHTVIEWIMAHGYQGAALLRKLMPILPFPDNMKTAILAILDILYPPVPAPV